MKIGLMSDSHGDVARTRRAAVRLRELGVESVLHAGDVGSGAVLDTLSTELGAWGIPVIVVEGNTDRAWGGLHGYPVGPGVHVAPGSRWQGTLGGLRISLLHGDNHRAFDVLVHSDGCDLVVFGHTHAREIRVEAGTTLMNPGALYRTPEPGAAWFDTVTRTGTFFDV